MTTRVFLPDEAARWIAVRLPLDLRTIRFLRVPKIPFWWLAPGRQFAGLTLWNRIYVVERCWCEPVNRATLELVLHELVHVIQYRRNPVLFPLRYIAGHLRYGYAANPAEVEAREVASRLAESFFHS